LAQPAGLKTNEQIIQEMIRVHEVTLLDEEKVYGEKDLLNG